jgi:hypothetical protein
MNTGKSNSRWRVIVAVGAASAITVTILFASFFPWLAAFVGLILLAGGVSYGAWPPVSERIFVARGAAPPSVQSRIYFGSPIAAYGVILLMLSQAEIRANWRNSETREKFAKSIEAVNSTVHEQQVEESLINETEEEYEVDGLVLLKKSVEGRGGSLGAEITGIVVNRGRRRSFALIQFNLYDATGARIGSAMANIDNLEAGERWSFEALSFETAFSTYKIDELRGS